MISFQRSGARKWTATLAQNGLTGAGVPQDWATHMISHELTALYDLDRARTLAVVLPALLDVQRASKREKLLQYGKRIWGIDSGNEVRPSTPTSPPRAPFSSLRIPTRLSGYQLGQAAVEAVINQLGALREHNDIDLATSRRILEAAL